MFSKCFNLQGLENVYLFHFAVFTTIKDNAFTHLPLIVHVFLKPVRTCTSSSVSSPYSVG